jgi:hypothetical protein
MARASVTGVVSARPDGATSLAIALAARLSASARTLLVDLNVTRPEVATLLDLDQRRNVYHLAFGSQVAPINPAELNEAISWVDSLACLAGIVHEDQADFLSEGFVAGLLEAAAINFDRVVLDLGRLRSKVPAASRVDLLLCAISPTPLGLAAFDRRWRVLEDDDVEWRSTLRPLLTRSKDTTLDGIENYLRLGTGLEVFGDLPDCPGIWNRLEYSHSLRELLAPGTDEAWFRRTFDEEVWHYRRSLDHLAESIVGVGVGVEESVLGN